MPRSATTLGSWVRTIARTLEHYGCDGAAALREAGIDARRLEDPNARFPLEQTTRLWHIARRQTGDAAIGLRVASQVTPATFHALGYTLGASATLKDAFERIRRYFRIVTDAGDLGFARHGDAYHIEIRPLERGPQPAAEAIDAMVSVHVRMSRAFAGSDTAPRRISLCRPPPPDPGSFARILRAPIEFAAPSNIIVFDRTVMERPLEGANPELASYHDEIARRYLLRFARSDIVARVESALLEQLPHGEPSQADIARALHLSPRSLQRKLAEQQSSYKQVLDGTRREMALSYLRDRRYPVSEVTYLLGFSDTSSFARACKRWTGRTPTQLREGDS